MRVILGVASLVFALGAAIQPAFAVWHKASSKHFVIYANENPDELASFATKLEKFDQAVRFARRMEDPPVGDGNRLTIFVVKDPQSVQNLAADASGFLAGFYIPSASGPLAFVPQSAGSMEIDPDIVFLHEYSHHILLQDLDRPYPEWLIEGFAEFLSTAGFKRDGTIVLGRVPRHRGYGIDNWSGLSLEELLAGNYGNVSDRQRETIYGKGWLLTHYLTFSKEREGQLGAYVTAIAKGVPALEAARGAFGDLKKLDGELRAYTHKRLIKALYIHASKLPSPEIKIQPMSAGAAQALPLMIQLKHLGSGQVPEPLAAEARQAETSFRGDPFVEEMLARAELGADHPAAAEVAADRALAADPHNIEAMILKGRSILRRADSAKNEPNPYATARSWFEKANRLDNHDPEPLVAFYSSFLLEGIKPTPNAVEGLHYASDLAPQDVGLRLTSAMQYLCDGDQQAARQRLTVIGYTPHGEAVADLARSMIARIDAGEYAALIRETNAACGK